MKPLFRLLAIYSKEFAGQDLLRDLMGGPPSGLSAEIETDLFRFSITITTSEHALRELSHWAHILDGVLLCCDLRHPLSPSLGVILSFVQAAQLPVVSGLMLFQRGEWLEHFEGQLREYISASGLLADEIPIAAFDAFSLSEPPAEWLSVLEESAQKKILPRWSLRRNGPLRAVISEVSEQAHCLGLLRGSIHQKKLFVFQTGTKPVTIASTSQGAEASFAESVWCRFAEGETLEAGLFVGEALPDIGRACARLYSSANTAPPLYATPKQERLISIHRSFGRVSLVEPNAKMFLIPPVVSLAPGAEANAFLTFSRAAQKEGGVTIRSFFPNAPGLAASWFVGDCFRWSYQQAEGFGVITSVYE